MENIENNILKEFGTLDPSVYSKSKFIEFIERYINENGDLSNTYEFYAGRNITLKVTKVEDKKWNVVFNYTPSIFPAVIIPEYFLEFGKTLLFSQEDYSVTITRNTYPLNEVKITGIDSEIHMDYESLINYIENESFTIPFGNNVISGSADTLGEITVTDFHGQSIIRSIRLNRQFRYFYGSLESYLTAIDHEELHSDSFQNQLGVIPETIVVDHGRSKTHLVILSQSDFEVSSNGIIIPMHETQETITPLEDDNTQYAGYFVKRSKHQLTGSFTYDIKIIE